MKKVSKKIFISAVLVLLAAGCSKSAPAKLGTDNTGLEQSSTNPSKITPQPATANQATSPPQSPFLNPPVDENAPHPANPKAPTITVQHFVDEGNQVVGGGVILYKGENELTLLKSIRLVETKSYTGLGEMVTSIDTIPADNKHFWEFFVNGKSSNVGAGSYILQDGDKIEWKLSAISASGE